MEPLSLYMPERCPEHGNEFRLGLREDMRNIMLLGPSWRSLWLGTKMYLRYPLREVKCLTRAWLGDDRLRSEKTIMGLVDEGYPVGRISKFTGVSREVIEVIISGHRRGDR